jgi:hypothetical protein
MKEIIYARSPYLITIGATSSQTLSKVELFIWKSNETQPATASVILSKSSPSPTQINTVYDISPYIRENISVNHLGIEDSVSGPALSSDNWCNVLVKKYYATASGTYNLISSTPYSATNGYSDYYLNVNHAPIPSNLFIYNNTSGSADFLTTLFYYDNSVGIKTNYTLLNYGHFPFLLERNGTSSYAFKYIDQAGNTSYSFSTTGIITGTGSFLLNIPYIDESYDTKFTLKVYKDNVLKSTICDYMLVSECKYVPVSVSYINRYGGVDYITFFKARQDNMEIKSTEYNMLPNFTYYNDGNSLYYDTQRGQSADFNVNGTRTIKVNTGWVEESFEQRIKDLMLSESIKLYDPKYNLFCIPVQLKSKSIKIQTSLNDKNINYTMDFDISYNLINNVI